ncbi:MAG: polysaccharide deacetylase family protein [Armatimonadota bacterium]
MVACLIVTGLLALRVEADLLDEGGVLLSAGKYVQAERAFTRVAEQDARCAVAVAGQGASQLFMGDHEAARDSFTRALALDPHCAGALVGRGAVRYVAGEYQKSMEAYGHALAYDVDYRAQIRASVAYNACLLGFYRSAEVDAKNAVAQDPNCELARQVLSAVYFVCERNEEALEILAAPVTNGTTISPALTVQSPLFSPQAAYYADHQLNPAIRLASLEPLGISAPAAATAEPETVAPTPEPEESGLAITYPAQGDRVRGAIEVGVRADSTLDVDYIALLLDDRFCGVSNARPFRIYVDTRLAPDGVRQLRCEAYGKDGNIVAQCQRLITVANGDRTLSPREIKRRADLDTILQSLLVLHADPLQRAQLCGHILRQDDRIVEAVDAFEYEFSYNPSMPGIRADLLLGYFEMGLLNGGRNEIHRLPSGAKKVALTFDDGPHPVLTPIILDLLDEHDARATFTLVGKQAETYPELVREIADRGHELANHSYSHRDLTTMSQLEVERELVMTRQVIRRACGEFVTLFRPPGGHYNQIVRQAARATGFSTVFWNENIGNYPGADPRQTAHDMLRKIGRQGIILLHNGYDETPEVLPHLLKLLQQEGYRMDTVSALTSHHAFRPEVARRGDVMEWSPL